MEIRNIQKTGGSSFNLTLPKDWIRHFNLKDKSKIAISVQKRGTMVIEPLYKKRRIIRSTINVNFLNDGIIKRSNSSGNVA